ncbi:MAG: exodeoxyribonuclease VII small subunit [Actinomycetales bacterium]|nr:exodeoxyribonuclease VII small subunit [Tetrasphaera sp.]NLW99775.1 exodeoxyribonuclease VII small subunit [Actinomycetales bacterium]
MSERTDGPAAQRDVAELSYEEAKEELTSIVSVLEAGSASLEESVRLWERGEALAAHCSQWLDEAQAAVEGGERRDPEQA